MRVIFAGSPAIAVPSLEALVNMEGVELVGVLTNPDTAKGRHATPTPTDVGEAINKIKNLRALAPLREANLTEPCGENLPVLLKPQKLDAAAREQISALKPDLLVSFAYGHIFGPKFLSLFTLGGINIHPSLLPKYRGPTPIQAAILNRDSVTGISIQKIALEIDSGNILAQEEIALDGTETTASLSEVVAKKSALMLPIAIKKIASGEQGIPQDQEALSYCKLISSEDGTIDWNLSAVEIEAKIRSLTPWPLCRTIHNGRFLFILKSSVYACDTPGGKIGQVLGSDKQYGILIQTGEGILAVTQLQYQQKKALLWKDFLNGARDFIGTILR